jgi:DNA-binding MarR family transcriptional regulator/N-acetylglutamate synthase-like GNAT family acetyltransferase
MTSAIEPPAADHVRALRAFNRFYSRRVGILEPYLDSEFSLTEVRVLYELAHRDQPAPAEIGRELGLDAAYLGRILKRFEARGWLERAPSPADARQSLLRLTADGHAAFGPLQQRSRDEAARLLAPLTPAARARLLASLATVRELLDEAPTVPAARTFLLRDPGPGDMGWVVQQHGELYAREYGWNGEFEALVARVVADFISKFQPEWERCWIAECGGDRVGSVFLVRKSPRVAQLRLLLLMPPARGHGLGGRLTDECIGFARAKGYRDMVLWTHSNLLAARAIYAARGFVCVKSEPYTGYGGHALVGETWALKL